jgi:hypothetical protein
MFRKDVLPEQFTRSDRGQDQWQRTAYRQSATRQLSDLSDRNASIARVTSVFGPAHADLAAIVSAAWAWQKTRRRSTGRLRVSARIF